LKEKSVELINISTNIQHTQQIMYYDNVGNRLSRTDKLGTESYEYDSMYRLTRANYADGNTTAFECDPAGNRTKMIDSEEGETAYQYNSANQLISKLHTSLLSNITQTAYTYDPAGTLKKKIENTEETIYTFDRKNMLLKIDYPQVAVPKPANEFKYNAFMRRMYKKDSDGERYYHLADGLGSVSYLINDAAKVIQEHRYRAFGERANTDAGLSRFTYTGREFDIDSGLYYYRSRYYDSSVGRFISKDMARSGLNYYTYVQNNPIRYADPRGEKGEEYSDLIKQIISDDYNPEAIADSLIALRNSGVEEDKLMDIFMKCIGDAAAYESYATGGSAARIEREEAVMAARHQASLEQHQAEQEAASQQMMWEAEQQTAMMDAWVEQFTIESERTYAEMQEKIDQEYKLAQEQEKKKGTGGGGLEIGGSVTDKDKLKDTCPVTLKMHPVQGKSIITSEYGKQRGDKYHAGVDIAGRNDDGTIRLDATIQASITGPIQVGNDPNGYGIYIAQYDSTSKTYIIYAHLKETLTVSNPNWVKAGTPIGTMGTTGSSDAVHLHFEITSTLKSSNTRVYYKPVLPK